tara:strand:+ start:761 stop:1516 length:756 start_codon:yes stop_codon:yes gene_type:complete
MTQELDPKEMSLIDHLDELRTVIIRMLLTLSLASLIGFVFSEHLLHLLLRQAPGVDFVVIAPTEGFFTQLKVAILGGVFVSFPILVLQLWGFIAPGLKAAEAKFVYRTTPFIVILFVSGLVLAYFFVIPLGLKFLLNFQIAEVTANLSIEKYVSFCFTLMMVFGILMELPVFLLILHAVGLVNRASLVQYRAHFVVSFFILSALLTPPDIVTQVLVAAPMVILYEFSLVAMKFREMGRRTQCDDSENSSFS